MRSKKAGQVTSLVAVIVFIFACVVFNGASARTSKNAAPQQEGPMPKLMNYVSAFKVESFERVKDDFILRLRNISDKGISAYSYSFGPVNRPTNRHDTDGLIGDIVIYPDAVEEIQIPAIALVRSAKGSPRHESIINIAAVVFEDRTVEGDQKITAFITDRRLGEKIQLERIHRLLKEALNTTGGDITSKLSNLEARIAALSEEPETGQSDAVKTGLHSAKENVLYLLRDHLTTGAVDINKQEALKHVANQTEEWLFKY